MKKIRTFFLKVKFLGVLILVLFFMILFQACKKTSIKEDISSEISNRQNVVEKFLKLPLNAEPSLFRIATKMKNLNDQYEYIAKFAKENGFPIWDKAFMSNRSNNRGGVSSFGAGIVGVVDTLIIIPLVNQDSTYVNGFISAKLNANVELSFYRGGDYSIYSFDNVPSDSINADKAVLQIMRLNQIVFGYSQFIVNDNRLFSNSSVRNIELPNRKFTLIDSISNINGIVTIMECEQTCVQWVCAICLNHYPQNVDCPIGGGGEICGAEICYETTEPPSPGGGGGTNTGGNPNGNPYPCPTTQARGIPGPCCGCVVIPPIIPIPPIPPYVVYECNYTLTAADQLIIDELNAEDAEDNNIYQNLDCKGTKRGGNINFQGTKEHWIIQLDYLSKNTFYGEIEYAIPQSSALGNRGYCDIANLYSNELFEIKPDNPNGSGMTNGITEVNRYCLKANLFCPSNAGSIPPVWHPGTDYPLNYLPSANPNMQLQVRLMAGGVIGYKEIPTHSAPPSPVIIPVTILDKVARLVERLRNNIADADRIITEYLRQNPGLVTYLKTGAVAAAVAIIVGTIAQDFFSGGAGILDDLVCFKLAYKIVRFAWKFA